MSKRKWRRGLFAPERRRRQAVIAGMIFVSMIFSIAADYIGNQGGKYLDRERGQALLELGEEKKPPRKSEYGLHVEWREGRIIFYRAEEEPYILKEAETTVTH